MTQDYPSTQQHPLFRLIHYMRPHRDRVIVAVLFSILNKLFDIAPPALIGAAVEIVVNREQSFFARLGIESVERQLMVLAGVTLFIWVF